MRSSNIVRIFHVSHLLKILQIMEFKDLYITSLYLLQNNARFFLSNKKPYYTYPQRPTMRKLALENTFLVVVVHLLVPSTMNFRTIMVVLFSAWVSC